MPYVIIVLSVASNLGYIDISVVPLMFLFNAPDQQCKVAIHMEVREGRGEPLYLMLDKTLKDQGDTECFLLYKFGIKM